MSRSVWALADEEVTEHLHHSEEGVARLWLGNMMQTLRMADQTRVYVTLWAIWHARRKALHEQIYQSPLSVHSFVEVFLKDLRVSAMGKERRPRSEVDSPA